MPSAPIKRSRKGPPGTISPYFPKAPKPADWYVMDMAQRIETAFACSLDRAMDYLSWPPDRCDPHMLAAQKEAVRCMLMIGARYGIAQARQNARMKTLEVLAHKLAPNASEED